MIKNKFVIPKVPKNLNHNNESSSSHSE